MGIIERANYDSEKCGEGGRGEGWRGWRALESTGSIRVFAMRRHRKANLVCSTREMFFSCLGREELIEGLEIRILGGENVGGGGVREKLFWIGGEIKNVRIEEFEG